jgi:hypothetical protein
LDSWDTLQLKRGVVPEQDLRSILNSSPSSIDEFLNKYLSKHSVGLFAEDGAKDHGNSIVAGLYIYGLLLSIVDCLNLTSLSDTLGSLLGCKLGSLFLQLVVLLVSLLEWRGHGVALQESEFESQLITFLCSMVSIEIPTIIRRAVSSTL